MGARCCCSSWAMSVFTFACPVVWPSFFTSRFELSLLTPRGVSPRSRSDTFGDWIFAHDWGILWDRGMLYTLERRAPCNLHFPILWSFFHPTFIFTFPSNVMRACTRLARVAIGQHSRAYNARTFTCAEQSARLQVWNCFIYLLEFSPLRVACLGVSTFAQFGWAIFARHPGWCAFLINIAFVWLKHS